MVSYPFKLVLLYCIYFFTLSFGAKAQDTLLDTGHLKPANTTVDTLMVDSTVSAELQRTRIVKQIQTSFDSLTRETQRIQLALDHPDTLTLTDLNTYEKALIAGQEKIKTWRQVLRSDETPPDTVGLVTDVMNLYFKLGALRGEVEESIRRMENASIKKKAGFIWSAPVRVNPEDVWGSLRDFFQVPTRALSAFTRSDWGGISLLILLTFGFFYWLFQNIRKLPERQSPPILESLLFFLVLLPLFNRSISSVYLEINYLIVLLLVAQKFKAHLQISASKWWLAFILLYVSTMGIQQMIMVNGFIIRIVALFLDVIGLMFGYYTFRHLKKVGFYTSVNRLIFSIYMILLFSAIVLNVIGQINVSKLASITAFVSIAQWIGLVAFVKLVLEAIHVQFVVQRKRSRKRISHLNKGRILILAKKVLFLVSIILWLIVFSINMDIRDPVDRFFGAILYKPRTFGSVTFTLGNLLYFLIIVGIANWFQKNLDVFFSNPNSKRLDQQTQHKGTKITLLRLTIIIIGFLLGVTALGISMDKLTVIIGALSVGIGLGLQNIFNNFVSGIILIFEKPFQIGDYIELAEKKGRVQKIGIRSSTLLTQQGSEVIIPNGDLLSGRLVNWTLSTSYSKSELTLKMAPSVDIENTKAIIMEEVQKNEYSIKEIPTEVLYHALTADGIEFKIQCWIINIYQEPLFRSRLLETLRSRFADNEILSLQ